MKFRQENSQDDDDDNDPNKSFIYFSNIKKNSEHKIVNINIKKKNYHRM